MPQLKIDTTMSFDGEGLFLELGKNRFQKNKYSHISLDSLSGIVSRMTGGKGVIISDGLEGIIADGSPTAATVVLLQNIGGIYVEVAKVESLDGSWRVEDLRQISTHAVAFKENYNAGIVADITPGE